MKKIKILTVVLATLIIMPCTAYAKEDISDGFEIVSQTEKYYKTITNNNSLQLTANQQTTQSYEVTKEEYETSEKTMQSK